MGEGVAVLVEGPEGASPFEGPLSTVRGSDPGAAVCWLARRPMVHALEEVGKVGPAALVLGVAAATCASKGNAVPGEKELGRRLKELRG